MSFDDTINYGYDSIVNSDTYISNCEDSYRQIEMNNKSSTDVYNNRPLNYELETRHNDFLKRIEREDKYKNIEKHYKDSNSNLSISKDSLAKMIREAVQHNKTPTTSTPTLPLTDVNYNTNANMLINNLIDQRTLTWLLIIFIIIYTINQHMNLRNLQLSFNTLLQNQSSQKTTNTTSS